MNKLKFTLKAWPVIAIATIGLCFLTKCAAELFGITLPDQGSLDVVKKAAGFNLAFLSILLQILVLAPIIEELLFRGLFWKLPSKLLKVPAWGLIAFSAALFSFAHYPDYEKIITHYRIFGSWVMCFRPLDAAFLALAFFGVAQIWLYKKTGSIWCAVLNHALFNLTNLVLLFIVPDSF